MKENRRKTVTADPPDTCQTCFKQRETFKFCIYDKLESLSQYT